MSATDATVEGAARSMAILDDHDGCFLEVDAWNAQEEWEREAYPDSYPGSAIEDCAYWIAKARAALEAAAPHIAAQALREASAAYPLETAYGGAEHAVQWLKARAEHTEAAPTGAASLVPKEDKP